MPASPQRYSAGWEVRVVVVAGVDAVKTRIIRGEGLRDGECTFSVLNFQSNMQSFNPPLGSTAARSPDAEDEGTGADGWVTVCAAAVFK